MGGVSRATGNLYDLNGNRVRVIHPDSAYFTYDHDGLDRPTVVRENGGAPIATFAYDHAGRRASSGWAATTSYAYDPVGRLQTLSHNLAGASRDHTPSASPTIPPRRSTAGRRATTPSPGAAL